MPRASLIDGRARDSDFDDDVAKHIPNIAGYFHNRLESSEDVLDCVQETFLQTIRRKGDFPQDESQQKAWLFGIAFGVLRNHRRSAHRQERLRIRSIRFAVTEHSTFSETRVDVSRALQLLNGTDRELMLLIAWEQLTPSEAAQILGISPGAARSRLLRARRSLQIQLGSTPSIGLHK